MKNIRPVITIITDFGLDDEYVGVLRGVILQHTTDIHIIDISHAVPPQDIRTASYLLARSYTYFPKGTVHLAVIDPGVGSARPIIALKADSHYFVGPDNGIFTPVFQTAKTVTVYKVTNVEYFLDSVSNTFHGRDIMAPVAARIATGLAIQNLGPQINADECTVMHNPLCVSVQNALQGAITHIDRFGNLCTNISKERLLKYSNNLEIKIQAGKVTIDSLNTSYGAKTGGTAIALFDSNDYLEIAVPGGNASQVLELKTGMTVNIFRK
jgi:S-adenosylmethionine hydrolase